MSGKKFLQKEATRSRFAAKHLHTGLKAITALLDDGSNDDARKLAMELLPDLATIEVEGDWPEEELNGFNDVLRLLPGHLNALGSSSDDSAALLQKAIKQLDSTDLQDPSQPWRNDLRRTCIELIEIQVQ